MLFRSPDCSGTAYAVDASLPAQIANAQFAHPVGEPRTDPLRYDVGAATSAGRPTAEVTVNSTAMPQFIANELVLTCFTSG